MNLFNLSRYGAILLLFVLILQGCRQDMLQREDNSQHYATAQSKFQMVKLKDIPHVSGFIKKKTGRNDLKIPMAAKSSALAKGALEFSTLETDFILKTIQDSLVYYIFNISNAGDESTIYNFEVKEIGGDVVRAELIEYASATPFEADYSNLQRFTGTVTAYNETRETISVGIFDNGVNPACPPLPGGIPGEGSGGLEPVIPLPGNPQDPYNPLPTPGWPGVPSNPPASSGPGSGENPIVPSTGGCGQYHLEVPMSKNDKGEDVGLWMNDCGDVYYGTQSQSYAVTRMKLTPHCNDGSGVIILPAKPKTPCEKIKDNFADEKFKEKVTAIDKNDVFNMDHEMGYAAGYPVNTSLTGTQYPPMENKIGTHSVSLPGGVQYFGFIHSHTNREGAIKIFSPGDLQNFLMRCVKAAQQFGHISDAYAMVITSQGNYMLKFSGTNFNQIIGTGTKDWWDKWYKKEMEAIQNEDGTYDQNKVEKAFLKFLKERVKIDGVELYSVEKNTGKAKKLTLNSNNSIVPTDCP